MHRTPKKRIITTMQFIMLNNSQTKQELETRPAPAPLLGTIAEYSSQARKVEINDAARRRFKLLRTAAKLLSNERIAQCQSAIAPEQSVVEVRVDSNQIGAKFHNLVRCESNSCPHCAAARSEQDRHELSLALAQAIEHNIFPMLLTFTLSHHAGDRLESLRAALRTAFDKTFSGRWFQTFKAEWRVVGKITSTEVTHGKNGWHPHLHVLLFTELEYAGKWPEAMELQISERWITKLKTLGFTANLAHGVDVRTAESDIADYIAKWGREPLEAGWGADTEIAKANVKHATSGGLTPFQLLGAAAGIQADLDAACLLLGADREIVKKRCAGLYIEYFAAMKGRARLHWGDMWRLLDMDAAVADFEHENPAKDADTWTICFFERGEIWNYLRGVKTGVDLRAELLEVCATKDAWQVRSWLRSHRIRGGVTDDAFERSLLFVEVSNESEEANVLSEV
jgi:plasmid rolling circle replication initiator protein Rep